jgi:curved DNA-binding protein CbpA
VKARRASPDYYRILGLPRNATVMDIKRAHRRLAKEHHPDGRGGARSEEFVLIQEAYDALSDPERRRKYDRYGDPFFDEELMVRLQRFYGTQGHPFLHFALRYHYRRMVNVGCPRCREMETCRAWRERLQVINCPVQKRCDVNG